MSRIDAILAMALHPGTDENEAANAFAAYRNALGRGQRPSPAALSAVANAPAAGLEALAWTPMPATAVANAFIARHRGRYSPLQLQKLVYLAHGWHLVFHNAPLLNEAILVGEHGPVIFSLRLETHGRGSDGLRAPLSQYVSELGERQVFNLPTGPRSADLRDLIAAVDDRYGHFSGTQLSALCHAAGTPWQRHQDSVKPVLYSTLPDALIAEHFAALLPAAQAA